MVFSSIGDPPPKIGVYLGLLTAILRFLKSIASTSRNRGPFGAINRYFGVSVDSKKQCEIGGSQ